jgi:POT family proton-dependent oligopeptide transporter
MTTNLVSQAVDVTMLGLPNNTLASINATTMLVLLLAVQYVLYPALSRHHISFSPVRRWALGIAAEAAAMTYAAGVKRTINTSPPCFCVLRQWVTTTTTGIAGLDRVQVLLQAHVYVLEAAGEVLATPVV